jgi:hexosaminidase
MLDLSRYFQPIEALERTIRGMQINKLNILHLHITDSESFPFLLLQFPQVTVHGAYSEEQTYTNEDFSDLIDFASERGVIIVPEIDQPAHTRSWALAPEL